MKNEAVKSRIAGAETKNGTIRSSSTLTNSFVAGTTIEVEDYGMLVLLVKYTMGSGETANSVVLKVEVSVDGTSFYQQTSNEASVSLKEYTFDAVSAAGSYDYFKIDIPVAALNYVKVSAKETGVSTNYGTCEIKYSTGW